MRRPRVHTHCLPANIVVGIDLRLHQQIVESMVAAHEDDGIYLLVLNKMHAVVDPAVHKPIAAGREPVTHLVGAGRELDVGLDAAFGKKVLRLRRKNRKILHALKHHYGELSLRSCLLSMSRRRGETCRPDRGQRQNPFSKTPHRTCPFSFCNACITARSFSQRA